MTKLPNLNLIKNNHIRIQLTNKSRIQARHSISQENNFFIVYLKFAIFCSMNIRNY